MAKRKSTLYYEDIRAWCKTRPYYKNLIPNYQYGAYAFNYKYDVPCCLFQVNSFLSDKDRYQHKRFTKKQKDMYCDYMLEHLAPIFIKHKIGVIDFSFTNKVHKYESYHFNKLLGIYEKP